MGVAGQDLDQEWGSLQGLGPISLISGTES